MEDGGELVYARSLRSGDIKLEKVRRQHKDDARRSRGRKIQGTEE